MFADPVTIAADSPTPSLIFRVVSYNNEGATRRDVTNGWALNISHSSSSKKGERHYMQLQQTVTAVDPITGGNALQVASASLSVSIPPFGWSAAQKVAVVQALLDTLNDSEVTIGGLLNFNS